MHYGGATRVGGCDCGSGSASGCECRTLGGVEECPGGLCPPPNYSEPAPASEWDAQASYWNAYNATNPDQNAPPPPAPATGYEGWTDAQIAAYRGDMYGPSPGALAPLAARPSGSAYDAPTAYYGRAPASAPTYAPPAQSSGFFSNLWSSLWTPQAGSEASNWAAMFDTSRYYQSTVPAMERYVSTVQSAAAQSVRQQESLASQNQQAAAGLLSSVKSAASMLDRPIPVVIDARSGLFQLQPSQGVVKGAPAAKSSLLLPALGVAAAAALFVAWKRRKARGGSSRASGG